MSEEIYNIEKSIFPEIELQKSHSFLAKNLSPAERIIRYSKNPKVGFQYICARNSNLSFEADAAYVTLLPEERQELLISGKEMMDHGIKTGRFKLGSDKILADVVKGNTGEQAGITLLNLAFECFGLDTRLKINKLKYDGRGDSGRDVVIGLYGIDFKFRNDVSQYIDLVVSSYDPSPYCILIHTHSVRRKDDTNYSDSFYLDVGDSSHIVVIRGGISGAKFADISEKFQNGRSVLNDSRKKLIPIWDLVSFLAIQAAKQEGYVE